MASTDSIWALRNRLQSMEVALADYMMESILRLQALTEAKVFLLIENSGKDRKRRYGGSGELIEKYEDGQLHPEPKELAVELNKTAVSHVLTERRANKRRGDEITVS